ncbi:MAG: PAS domain-containing protein [Novosphingobium sp.]
MGVFVPDHLFKDIVHADRRRWRGPRGLAVDSLMASTRRELSLLSADLMGAQALVGQFGPGDGSRPPARADRRLFRNIIENSTELYMVLDPRAGLHIVDINEAYAAQTLVSRRRTPGEKLFDVFPDNPDLHDADGVGNLFESLQRTAQSGRPHTMAVQRYDVQDADGRFVEKHWRCTNIPIFDDKGRLTFLLHHAQDVTPE